MPVMLEAEDLALVQKIVADAMGDTSYTVYAFGSRAKGTAVKYSDLDLAIECAGSNLPWEKKAALSWQFEESLLPFKVDVVDLRDITPGFKAAIQNDLVRLG